MFKELCYQLYEYGWNIIPVAGKRPLIPQWTQYADEQPSASEVAKWVKRFPKANVGLVLGGSSKVVALDIDIDDTEKVADIILEAENIFGRSTATRYGRVPRCVQLYRGNTKTSIGSVEFLSSGRQVVIFGNHPVTNNLYTWEDYSPLNLEPKDLPMITEEQVQRFMFKIHRHLPLLVRGNGNANLDVDYFEALKDARKGKDAFSRRNAICVQLQEGEPGNWHNTLISCVSALASDGCTKERIHQIVEYNYNAPRTGEYSGDWQNLPEIISTAVERFGKK